MNGLDLHEHVMALTKELERYPKLALANVLASQTLISDYVFANGISEEVVKHATDQLRDAVKKAEPIARYAYQTRRHRRLLDQIENPRPRRKRRKKKRRSKRGL